MGELLRERRQTWLQGGVSSVADLQWAGCCRVVGILSHGGIRGWLRPVPREESQDFSTFWVQHCREDHSVT